MNIKKIIAREGLILIGFVAVFLFSSFNNDNLAMYAYFGYPLYLLIRFIIWAIKTLKEK